MLELADRARVLTERLDVAVDDGTRMAVYVAWPQDANGADGVVVAGELFGVTAHARDVCERLAALGFVAAAPDLYHRTAPGLELPHTPDGRARGFELLHRLTREDALADIRAAVAELRRRGCGAVGIVGLSLGGHVAYLAATELDLAATVVAYGGWLTSTEIPLSQPEPTIERTSGITGRLLVLVGEDDHAITEADREAIAAALRAAGVEHELVAYPGVTHGFLCDRRDTFAPGAADDAWRRIDAFLGSELQRGGVGGPRA